MVQHKAYVHGTREGEDDPLYNEVLQRLFSSTTKERSQLSFSTQNHHFGSSTRVAGPFWRMYSTTWGLTRCPRAYSPPLALAMLEFERRTLATGQSVTPEWLSGSSKWHSRLRQSALLSILRAAIHLNSSHFI